MSLWPFVSNLLNMQVPAWLLASSTPTTGSLSVHPALSGVTCRRSARLPFEGLLADGCSPKDDGEGGLFERPSQLQLGWHVSLSRSLAPPPGSFGVAREVGTPCTSI